MDTPNHTPGAWHIGHGNGEGNVFAANGRTRLEPGGTALYPVAICSTGYDEDEDRANAALIAAVPEMLAALEMVSGGIVPGQDAVIVFAIIEKVRAAIAKTKGEL